MSDKKVTVEIETTAKTEGAKEARRELAAVETQAKAASSAADEAVEYGKSPGLGAELEAKFKAATDQAAKLKEEVKSTKDESEDAGTALAGAATKAAAFAGVVQILNQASALIREIGQEQRELNGEADDWVNVIGMVEDAVKSLLDPVKLGYDLFSGYDALFAELNNKVQAHTNKTLAAYVDSIEKRRKADQDYANDRSLERKFDREKDAVNEQIRRLERRNELTAAARDSADRVRDARDQTQIERIERGPGTDSQKEQEIANIKLQGITRDLSNQIAELNDNLETQRAKIAELEGESAKLGNSAGSAAAELTKAEDALQQFESKAALAIKLFTDADNSSAQAQRTRDEGGFRSTSLAAGFDQQAAEARRAAQGAIGDPSLKSASDITAKIEELKQAFQKQREDFEKINTAFDANTESLKVARENLSDTAQKNALEIEALKAEAAAERESVLGQVKDVQKQEIQKQADDVTEKVQELGSEAKKARDEITDAAKEALKAANEAATEAQESGQQSSTNLRTAITKLNQVLADGSVSPDEMGKLGAGLAALKKSHEMVGNKVTESTAEQVAFNAKTLAKLDAQSRQLAAQQAQINQLLSR